MNYGWVLIGLVVLYYLRPRFSQWLQSWRDAKAAGQHHKDEDQAEVVAREAAVEAARRRLQEQYTAQAAEAAERRRQRDEAKRLEKLAAEEKMVKCGGGQRVGEQAKEEKKFTARPEYNPLMGGGSCGWRPQQRRAGAG